MYGYNGMGLGGMYGRQMMQQSPQFGGGIYGQQGFSGPMPSPYLLPQQMQLMPAMLQRQQIPMQQMPMQQMQQIPRQMMPMQSMTPQAMPQSPQMGLGGMYGRQFNGY